MQSQLCYFGGSVHVAPAELKIKKALTLFFPKEYQG